MLTWSVHVGLWGIAAAWLVVATWSVGRNSIGRGKRQGECKGAGEAWGAVVTLQAHCVPRKATASVQA